MLPILLTASLAAHPYCNVAMDTGVVPPLPSDTNLVQVHTLIRHGSRTKCSVGAEQWAGESDTVYDCSASLLLGPDANTSTKILFRKLYTPGKNQLRGNCALGQLVASGLEMQRASGRRLRAAYEKLLPSSLAGGTDAFFLRSDDCPRTLASGQALFDAMYDSEHSAVVPWHTEDADGENTITCSSTVVCPAFAAARAKAVATAEALPHYQNATLPLAAALSRALNRSVGASGIEPLLDSLMSVQCPTVPSSGGEPPASFTPSLQAAALAEITYQTYVVNNDTAVSRLGAGPLLGEVLVSMEAAAAGHGAPKFVLLSGHDTGPMAPVLAALRIGGAEFPRFADLIAIELHRQAPAPARRQAPTGYTGAASGMEAGAASGMEAGAASAMEAGAASGLSVRIVHNGQVVTPLVPGCPSAELCPFADFHAAAAALVPTPRECGRSDSPAWWPHPSEEWA